VDVTIHALYFTSRGNGPAPVSLRVKPMAAIIDGDEEIAPRSIGIMVDSTDALGCALVGVDPGGGYNLGEEQVDALIAALVEWRGTEAAEGCEGTIGIPGTVIPGMVTLATPSAAYLFEPDRAIALGRSLIAAGEAVRR
jgi:hypothetical protein